jgi:hypothetical protein
MLHCWGPRVARTLPGLGCAVVGRVGAEQVAGKTAWLSFIYTREAFAHRLTQLHSAGRARCTQALMPPKTSDAGNTSWAITPRKDCSCDQSDVARLCGSAWQVHMQLDSNPKREEGEK